MIRREPFLDSLGRGRSRMIGACEACGVEFRMDRTDRKYCSPACMGAARTESVVLAFWSNVLKTESCWTWTGTRNSRGYGVVGIGRKQVRAHRLAWEMTSGEIADGLIVCHRCDNPPCVRPDHLFLGTNNDNMADMVSKGRQVTGNRHWTRKDPAKAHEVALRNAEKLPRMYGADNPKSKLSETKVREIRERHQQGESMHSLARAYEVSRPVIKSVVKGETWKWVA